MNFKAIFFDNDGLLVNTEPLYLDSTREILKEVGVEVTEEWFVREQLGRGRSMFELARAAGVSDDGIETLRQRRNKRYGEMLRERVEPKDGIRETLEILCGKFLMGVVTSSRKDHFEIVLEKTGLRKFFSFFVTADDVKKVKPSPDLYLHALEISQKPAALCLALEDTHHGIQAAKAAGLTAYAIPSTFTKVHDFSIADRVLRSIREVPGLVL